MANTLQILGIAGSLRKASYNRSALRAAAEVIPAGAALSIYERLGELPLFNQDVERDPPEPVKDFKARIKGADAILIATPEYNFSIPGVLKNAIDWASRPSGESAWSGKPVAIFGASGGRFGTVRAQLHLRQCFVTLNMPAVNKPEVMISNAAEAFDKDGALKDDKARQLITELVQALVDLGRLHKK